MSDMERQKSKWFTIDNVHINLDEVVFFSWAGDLVHIRLNGEANVFKVFDHDKRLYAGLCDVLGIAMVKEIIEVEERVE